MQIRATVGAISLRRPSHFPPSAGSKLWNPVMFPAGRARLVTYPLPTESDTHVKTIGMVRVSWLRADSTGLVETKITSGAIAVDLLGIIVEPEGHMVADKRADITAALPGRKLILELKRDIHAELWSAPATQLDRFYTRDPEASGYGVFGVFWYGKHRQGTVPRHPKGNTAPKCALELETMLNDIIVAEQRSKLRAVVIDVSVPDGQRVGAAKRRRKKPKPSKPKPG
jgi:hypothetical protein